MDNTTWRIAATNPNFFITADPDENINTTDHNPDTDNNPAADTATDPDTDQNPDPDTNPDPDPNPENHPEFNVQTTDDRKREKPDTDHTHRRST